MGLNLLPLYIVADTSESMGWGDHPPIKELNGLMDRIVALCEEDDRLQKSLWLEVITFDTDAKVAVPAGRYEDFREVTPHFEAGGLTCYGKAFRLLHQELDDQHQELKTMAALEGLRLNRPAVFFITDGRWQGKDGGNGPDDGNDPAVYETEEECEEAWRGIAGMSEDVRPNVITLGLANDRMCRNPGEADAFKDSLRNYTCGKHGFSYVANDGGAAQQLSYFIDQILTSVTMSLTPGHTGYDDRVAELFQERVDPDVRM